MSEILFHYKRVDPTTWVYLSSLLMIGLFFKFNRFWSVRNLDLVLLILLAPGLLLVHHGRQRQEQIVAQRIDAELDAKASGEADSPSERGDSGPPGGTPGAAPPGTIPPGNGAAEDENPREPKAVEPTEPDGPRAPDKSQPDDRDPKEENKIETATDDAFQRRSFPGFFLTSTFQQDDPATVGNEAAESAPKSESPTGSDPPAANSEATPDADVTTPVIDPEWESAREEFKAARHVELTGFAWLLAVGFLLVARLMIDPTMARRPLLEPNLSPGGLAFICVSLFVFLMANVVANAPPDGPSEAAVEMRHRLTGERPSEHPPEIRQGPRYVLLELFPGIPTTPLTSGANSGEASLVTASKAMAILSHLAIVIGIAAIGHRHFDNLKMGIGAATMYLMLPYTHQMTGMIDHSIPAALLVWAVLCYRRPLWAGVFIGLAIGCYYYPMFLLPLWISFYWQRGLTRFVGGASIMLTALVLMLLLKSADGGEFLGHLRSMFGFWFPLWQGLEGFWGLVGEDVAWFRTTVLVAFLGLIWTLAIWPAQKNLGTLLSCSGAVMVATQFWHGFGGGLFMGWYLPLLLLTIFRPNLEDRIALSVLGQGWFPRRRMAA